MNWLDKMLDKKDDIYGYWIILRRKDKDMDWGKESAEEDMYKR